MTGVGCDSRESRRAGRDIADDGVNLTTELLTHSALCKRSGGGWRERERGAEKERTRPIPGSTDNDEDKVIAFADSIFRLPNRDPSSRTFTTATMK